MRLVLRFRLVYRAWIGDLGHGLGLALVRERLLVRRPPDATTFFGRFADLTLRGRLALLRRSRGYGLAHGLLLADCAGAGGLRDCSRGS
jgi:hypothetical protein